MAAGWSGSGASAELMAEEAGSPCPPLYGLLHSPKTAKCMKSMSKSVALCDYLVSERLESQVEVEVGVYRGGGAG